MFDVGSEKNLSYDVVLARTMGNNILLNTV